MRVWNFTLLFVIAAVAANAGVVYNITDFGNLGGTSITAAGINAAGYVSGTVIDSSGTSRPFVFNGTTVSTLGTVGRGGSLNSNGQIAVTSFTDVGAVAALWSQGNFGVLATLESYAMAVNDSGTVVGSSQGRAYTHDGTTMTDVGGNNAWSTALGVNSSGQVAGYSLTTNGLMRGFVYSPATGLQQLGTLGGANSYATNVNSSGTVIGHASTVSGYLRAFEYINGQLVAIGSLGTRNSYAYGINSSGVIVGYSDVDGLSVTHGYVFINGIMYDLNKLLPAGSGYEIISAWAVNDSGQIAATAIKNGQQIGLRLDPVYFSDLTTHNPEPGTIVMLTLGIALIGLGKLRYSARS